MSIISITKTNRAPQIANDFYRDVYNLVNTFNKQVIPEAIETIKNDDYITRQDERLRISKIQNQQNIVNGFLESAQSGLEDENYPAVKMNLNAALENFVSLMNLVGSTGHEFDKRFEQKAARLENRLKRAPL